MRVVLTKKLAEAIDGIDLSSHNVGDVLDLPADQVRLIEAEQWGVADRRRTPRVHGSDLNGHRETDC